MIHSLIVLILASISCSLLGVFLILRGQSMITDAISHSVLLGIVLAFFITNDLSSPLLIVGATIVGVVTVFAIERLSKSSYVKKDDAIGVVYPLFFSLAIILISRYSGNAHLDTDMVLTGEVIYAGLDTIKILGLEFALASIKLAIILILNLLFILIFYKELKLSTFSPEYSKVMGLPMGLIFYIMMTLSSITTVVSFDAVGSILVVSLFISSAASALLISKKLGRVLILSSFLGLVNSLIGYSLSLYLNLSMSGMVAFVSMLTYILILLFNKQGLITRRIKLKKARNQVIYDSVIIHIGNHSLDLFINEETQVDEIYKHLNWPDNKIKKIFNSLIEKDYIKVKEDHYFLTERGESRYTFLKETYLT
ncbi:MAG: metal ABC transporter permease [Tissierellia bacterium]|nr:metal ABC transporter permease [Tissierellia bacterium]